MIAKKQNYLINSELFLQMLYANFRLGSLPGFPGVSRPLQQRKDLPTLTASSGGPLAHHRFSYQRAEPGKVPHQEINATLWSGPEFPMCSVGLPQNGGLG